MILNNYYNTLIISVHKETIVYSEGCVIPSSLNSHSTQGFQKGLGTGKLTSCKDSFACLIRPSRGKFFL